jgi:regulator of RNase E activity RraA
MYQINSQIERPDPALIEQAKDLYYCLVGCRVGPRYVVSHEIQALDRDWRICGPAVTVRPEQTDDVLMGMVAGKYVQPGDVVVIDAGGDQRAAALGASMANGLREQGAIGIVVDGYVLTAELLRKREAIPVFCRGSVSRSNPPASPGWINVPVICGGVIVNPGDLILGDEDGVVVVPCGHIEAVIRDVAGPDGGNYPKHPPDGNIPPREPQSEPYYKRSGAEEKVDAMDVVERS